MRFRGIRYWWAGIGVAVLVILYAGPLIAALRQPSISGPAAPLTSLTVPSAALPLLRVPKVHPLAPLPPLRAATTGRAAHAAAPKVVHHRVPVVSDTRSLPGTSGIKKTTTPVDLFSSVPTVVDTVGAPAQLPSAAAAPAAAPPTAPAAPPAPAAAPADSSATATPAADGGGAAGSAAAPVDATRSDVPRFLSVYDDSTPTPTPTDAGATSPPTTSSDSSSVSSPSSDSSSVSSPSSDSSSVSSPQSDTISSGTSDQTAASTAPPVITATVGGSGSSSVSAPSDTSTSTVTISGSTSTGATGSTSLTAPDTTSATEPTGSDSSTPSPSGQTGDGPGAGTATGIAGATGNGSTGSSGTVVGSTPATQSDGATTAPAGTSGSAPDPNANTSSGLSPPGSALVTPTTGGTATSADGSASVAFGAGSVPTDVTVSVSVGGTAPNGIDAVGSVVALKAVAGDGSAVDTFAAAPVLTIHYDPNGPVPSAIYYLDPVNGPTRIAGTVDTVAHTISAPLPHFSDYVAGDPLLTASKQALPGSTLTYDGTNMILTYADATTDMVAAAPGDAVTVQLSSSADTLAIGTLGSYTGPLTINGGAGNDTVSVTSDSNMSLSSTTLHYDSRDVTLASVESVDLTGGSGNNAFAFSDGFGSATVATGGGSDTLDFTGLTGVTHPTDTTFGDAGSDTLTLSSSPPDHIDLSLQTTGPGTNFNEATDLTGVVNTLRDVVKGVDNNTSALSTLLPLLDPSTAPSLDRLVKLTSSFTDLASAIATSVSSGAINALTSTFTLSQLIGALNGVITGLPSSNPLSGLHFSSAYGRTGSDLVAYLELDMNAPGICTSSGPGCVATSIPLNLGTLVSGLGLTLTDPSTGKPPAVTVGATIGVHVGIGFDPTTQTAYVDPTGHINLTASISSTALSATVNIGLLQASISSLPIGPLTGTVGLALPGGTTPIAASSFSASDVTPTVNANVDSLYTLHLSIDPGVKIGGSDLNGVGADLLISLGDTTDFVNHPNSVPLFGDGGQPPAIHVEVHTSLGGGSDLLNSLNPSEPSFGNADPNTIMSMLSQVASFFGSMASQQFLGTQIPFTTVTLGQLLDYAQQFKHEFLDPLFKSGDSTKPDANGDGKVDLQDFNFAGIQSLLGRLTAALGLGGSGLGGSGGPLSASYDPATGALTFNFSLTEQAGIGTDVQVTVGAGATVIDAGGSPDVQTIVLNADGGTFTVSYGGSTTSGLNWNADPTAIVGPALQGLPGLSSVTVTRPVNGMYIVTMTGVSNPALLSVDSTSLTDDGLVQTIVVPSSTSSFWIGYPDSNGVLGLTDALAKGISDGDLATALNALTGVQPGSVSIKSAAGTTSTAYRVKLNGSPSAGTKAFAAAGGLSLDFGASLGGLASLQTTGSVIPLAKLVAEGTFGINLNSSTSISVGPSAFQNGPQASVSTIQQGGKGITVTKVRQGLLNQVDAVWLVTVKGGGMFTLSAGGPPTSGLTPGTDITSAVEGLNGAWGTHVHVSMSQQPEGYVYTITWDSSVAPVSTFAGDGGSLTGQNEIDELQVQNANGGTFVLAFNGGTLMENYNVSAATLGAVSSPGLNDPSFTAVATVPDSSTAGTVTVTGSVGDHQDRVQGRLGRHGRLRHVDRLDEPDRHARHGEPSGQRHSRQQRDLRRGDHRRAGGPDADHAGRRRQRDHDDRPGRRHRARRQHDHAGRRVRPRGADAERPRLCRNVHAHERRRDGDESDRCEPGRDVAGNRSGERAGGEVDRRHRHRRADRRRQAADDHLHRHRRPAAARADDDGGVLRRERDPDRDRDRRGERHVHAHLQRHDERADRLQQRQPRDGRRLARGRRQRQRQPVGQHLHDHLRRHRRGRHEREAAEPGDEVAHRPERGADDHAAEHDGRHVHAHDGQRDDDLDGDRDRVQLGARRHRPAHRRVGDARIRRHARGGHLLLHDHRDHGLGRGRRLDRGARVHRRLERDDQPELDGAGLVELDW